MTRDLIKKKATARVPRAATNPVIFPLITRGWKALGGSRNNESEHRNPPETPERKKKPLRYLPIRIQALAETELTSAVRMGKKRSLRKKEKEKKAENRTREEERVGKRQSKTKRRREIRQAGASYPYTRPTQHQKKEQQVNE